MSALSPERVSKNSDVPDYCIGVAKRRRERKMECQRGNEKKRKKKEKRETSNNER